MTLQSIAGAATLGRYTLLRRIAIGGMGEIFLARERGAAGVERLVVIKRLLRDALDDGDPVGQFLDEARIAAHLSHPNIVQLHELGDEGGELFLVLELVPSQNLARVVGALGRAGGRLPMAIAGHILIEAARGLAHAHQARDADGRPLHIVHRDVSPSNILIGYRGEVKLADFGIAKARNRQSRTRTGLVRGKYPYMAPEQVRGGEVDARGDVWALGVVAWEVTVGRPLFDGSTDLDTIRQVLEAPIPRPTSIDPGYPPAVEAVILAALERDVERRLPAAERFAHQLRDALRATVGVADATELAALMAATFPAEQHELATLRDDAPAVETPTVQRPHDDDGVAAPRPVPARSRGAPIAAALVAVSIALAVVVVALTARDRASPEIAAAPSALADAAAPAPTVATDAAVVAPLPPAPIDATVAADAAPSGASARRRPDAAARPEPTRPPPDAAAPPPDAGAPDTAPAQIRFTVGAGKISIDGRLYRSGTPRVPPGRHHIAVELDDGRTLATDLDAAPGAIYKCVITGTSLTCTRGA